MLNTRQLLALFCAVSSAAVLSACVVPVGSEPTSGPAVAGAGAGAGAGAAPASTSAAPPVASMSGPTRAAPINNTARPPIPAPSGLASGPVTANVPITTSLMRDIAVEIGDAACDSDDQCRTLGVGAKACGGPEAYIAWSSKVNGKGARLTALAAAHTAERERENERSGMRSNCSVTPDPGAMCIPRPQDRLRACQTAQARRSGAV